jgi:hypothetical protein
MFQVIHFAALLESWQLSRGLARRTIGMRIRDLVRSHPVLADSLPDDIYRQVYRVASGTTPPVSTDELQEGE